MRTDLVVGAYIVKDNKILLVHHAKLDKWLPPGGHIDKNETPDDAIKREIKEELDLDVELVNPYDLNLPINGETKFNLATPFFVNVHSVGDHDHCCFFYICIPREDNISINKEVKNFKWFNRLELQSKYVPDDVKVHSIKVLDVFFKL